MSTVIIIAVVFFLFVLPAVRKARAGRRQARNLLDQVSETRTAGRAGDPQGLAAVQASISDAVQQVLVKQGLPSGQMSITSSVSTSTGGDGFAAAAPGERSLGVGDVLSVSSLSGSRVATVDLDAIGAPKRRITVDLAKDVELARGDRIYVELDPADPSRAALPSSMGDGFKLPAGINRLDAVVLGPAIMTQGAEGKAVVRAAEQVPLANPALGKTGASKWRLDLEVSPRSGFPYQADLTITLSSADKVARICHRGAEVPVRYDPAEPKTLTIDSPAMGYPNPYDALAATLTAAAMPGGSMIEQIAAVRAQRGVSLREAKEVVERMNAGPGAAPGPHSTSKTVDWNALRGMNKIEQIKAVRAQTGLDLTDAKDLVETMDALRGSGSDATAQMMAMLSGKRLT